MLRTAPGRERAKRRKNKKHFPRLVLVVSSRCDLTKQCACCECAERCEVLRMAYVRELAESVRTVRVVGSCYYFVE